MRFSVQTLVLVVSGTFLFFALLETAQAPTDSPGSREGALNARDEQIEGLIARMPLEQKIGQMFIFGIFTDDIEGWKEEFLLEKNIGSVILHRYNISSTEQVKQLTADLQEGVPYPELPLFIAVNQEGGEVRILGSLVEQEAGGRMIEGERDAVLAGRSVAQDLRALGITVNLAPVVDVVENPDSFLYRRSFSGNPATVAALAAAFIRGQQAEGIVSTAKHFPGHGLSAADPHDEMPVSSVAREDLEPHLLPFQAAIEEGVEMIMLTPISLPSIDEEPVPFSSVLVEQLLREDLGFEGIVITDDLLMASLASVHPSEEAAVEAVRAGTDILMLSGVMHAQRAAYEALLRAVRSGTISEERIDQSLRRIFRVKLEL